MITVHLILNAHIDPVWLWPWPSGLDAVLATCRSACDRLDAHPDVHFCRGEAWAYDQVERVAPRLFERIRRHVAAGRWHIVGGWWLQPDCNGPGGDGLAQQIALGRAYFEPRFGTFPRAGYNVDTFGHAATLPEILRTGGQDAYVMMRPQEHELALPARLFRWRGRPDGPEVVVFRIARGYAVRDLTVDHVLAATRDLPPGVADTMCFVGLGDHGGGPTERQIAWIAAHRDRIPGVRLEYSWPERFFDAVAPHRAALPLVVGELQSHAVGCYSVHRAVKVAVRRAEHRLAAADVALRQDPAPPPEAAARLAAAWPPVCFAHFHDTYGGTCIPSAYPAIEAQLGLAQATADELIEHALRRRLEALPDDGHHRIALWNPAATPFDGLVQHEAWFERVPFAPGSELRDETGAAVPCQTMHPEAMIAWDAPYFVRFVFRARLAPGELRTLRIVPPSGAAAPREDAGRPSPALAQGGGPARPGRPGAAAPLLEALAGPAPRALALPGGFRVPLPRLELIEDPTDTWSHGIDRYAESVADDGGVRPDVEPATWEPPVVLDDGPLLAAVEQHGRIGDCTLRSEWRRWAGLGGVEWHLRVHWRARHRVLKLTWVLPAALVRHTDGIPGGALTRTPTGAERPVRDWTLLELADGTRLGLVLPDAYGLDATPRRVRVTLLRSPLMAYHDPYPGPVVRGVAADQGVHVLRFRVVAGAGLTPETLEAQALEYHRPPVTADLTRGMAGE